MAKRSSADVGFLLVGQYSLLGQATRLEHRLQALTADTTTLGQSWIEHTYVGLRRAELDQDGWFDDATASSHEALVALPSAPRVVSYAPAGNAVGLPCVIAAGLVQVNYTRVVERGGVHKAAASYVASGQVAEGPILLPLGALPSGDGAGEVVDSGGATSGGLLVAAHVTTLSLGGHSALILAVQHSADGVTWADLAVISVTAPSGQSVQAPGLVQRYLRGRWEWTGSGDSPTATAMVAVART